MTQHTGPSIRERAASIAAAMGIPDFHADVLINAIDDITRIALAEQAARLANALAYCAEADNESMEQARTIRAQAVEIERLAGVIEIHRKATTTWRNSCHQAWRDLSAARAEAEANRVKIGAARAALNSVIAPDDNADSLIMDFMPMPDEDREYDDQGGMIGRPIEDNPAAMWQGEE